MNNATLTASSIWLTYGAGDAQTAALRGVSLTIGAAGPETVAIMGPSGSGKTSLLHVLAGIVRPSNGSVQWRGGDIAAMSDTRRTKLRRSDFGFVFQSGHLLPELPALENAALPLMLNGVSRANAAGRAKHLLNQLGLAGLEQRRPGELSGGQAQRVAIARALAVEPGIVFADEPTGALDRGTGNQVMDILASASLAAGASLIVVTHDPSVAARCSRTVRLQDGQIVADERSADAPASPACAMPKPTQVPPMSARQPLGTGWMGGAR